MRRLMALALLALLLPAGAWAQGIEFSPAVVAASGGTMTGPLLLPDGAAGTSSLGWPAVNPYVAVGFFRFQNGVSWQLGSTPYLYLSTSIGMNAVSSLYWAAGAPGFTAPDLTLVRKAAGTLAQENGDAPQFSRIYAGFSGYMEVGTATEEITLATGATTTDSTAFLLPAGAFIEFVTYRVTTTITTAANYSIGDATTPARFVSASTGLAAGSTGTGTLHLNPAATDAAGPRQPTAAKIRITTNANPGAGKIRVQVFYRTAGVPAT
jgi:hypothetical protein